MSQHSRFSAFVTYLLLVFGWLYVLLLRPRDRLAVFHTKQSITLAFTAIIVVLAWVVFGWLIAFIPFVGPIVSVASFGLVIIVLTALLVLWIVGMIYSLQAKLKPLPLTGRWAERVPLKADIQADTA